MAARYVCVGHNMMFVAKRKAIRKAPGHHPVRAARRAAVSSQPPSPTLSAAIARIATPPARIASTVLGDLIAPNPNDVRSAIPPRERIFPDYHASPAEIVSVTIVPADVYGPATAPAKIPRGPTVGARAPLRRGAQSISTALSALVAMGALALGVSPQFGGVQGPLRHVLASGRAAVHARFENGTQTLAGMVAGRATGEKQGEQPLTAPELAAMAIEPVQTAAAQAIVPEEPRQAAAEVSMRASLLNEPRLMIMTASVAAEAPAESAPKADGAPGTHVPLAGIWASVTVRTLAGHKPSAPAAVAAAPIAQQVPVSAVAPKTAAPRLVPAQGVTAVAAHAPAAKKLTKGETLPWANAPARSDTASSNSATDGVRNAANTRRGLGVTQAEKPARGHAAYVPPRDTDWARSLGDAHR